GRSRRRRSSVSALIASATLAFSLGVLASLPLPGMALDQRVELREADEVEPVMGGDHRCVLTGRIAPELAPVPHVEAERLAVQRREVDDAVDHDRRAGNLAAGGA